jgi:hypothetical protein
VRFVVVKASQGTIAARTLVAVSIRRRICAAIDDMAVVGGISVFQPNGAGVGMAGI